MAININKTKKSLAILYSSIVFVVIFILGVTFFSVRYYKEISIEKKDFNFFVNIIESKKISIDNMLNFGSRFDNMNLLNKIVNLNIKNESMMPREFMNYILIDKSGKISSINIKDNVTDIFLLEIIKENKYYDLTQKSGFIVKKIEFNDDSLLIIYKKLRYSFIEYFEDIFWFTIISLIFSFLIYYVGVRFINRIFIPVEENMKEMSNFIDNAGHELKTPISVIDSNIQLLKEMKVYNEPMLDELKGEVKKLNLLIDALVKLSNIDIFKDVQKVNLKEILNDIINDFKIKTEDKKITVNINIKDDVLINTNKEYFYIFLANLIGNAIKYNKIMGNIDILYKNNTLIIKDTGLGIKENDIKKIWDRFFKSDFSRNSEGYGIGLSLVKKISDVYGWKIKVNSVFGEGSEFIIKF